MVESNALHHVEKLDLVGRQRSLALELIERVFCCLAVEADQRADENPEPTIIADPLQVLGSRDSRFDEDALQLRQVLCREGLVPANLLNRYEPRRVCRRLIDLSYAAMASVSRAA